MGAGPRISHACRRTSAGRGGRCRSPGAASGPDGTLRLADGRDAVSRSRGPSHLPTSLPATSSCRATRPGTPRGRPGTSPSTSVPSPSSIPSRRTTSSRPCASPPQHDLRIAFNAGGHNAGPIDWTRDTLLLKTERMRGIEIDPDRAARARRGRGARRSPSPIAAGEHGLAYLAGTSPDVGVLGYALGGGLSWMVRSARPGLQHHRGGRRGHGRRPAASGSTATRSRSCSGRCAAAAATWPP